MIINTLKNLKPVLLEMKKAKIVAVDTETISLEDKTMVGISFAFRQNKKFLKYYIPIQHNNIKNMPETGQKKLLRAITLLPRVVYHNYSFDAQVLLKKGYEHKHIPHDSMVIAHLLNENQPVGLKKLAKRELKYDMLTFKEVCGVGKKQISFADLEDEVIIDKYASDDALFTLKLFLLLYNKLSKDIKLMRVYDVLEHPLLEVVVSMHNEGITVDRRKVKKIKKICLEKRDFYFSKLNFLMGGVNLNSSKQLREYFIEQNNCPVIKRSMKTNKPSVDAEVLKIYAENNMEADWLLKYRYYAKILSTFVPYFESKTNKVYASFNQSGTTSGRFSSSGPNLQNVPNEDKLGIRECVVASKGYKLISLDYSGVEMRLAAHFSGEEKLITAFNSGLDIHSQVAKEVGCSRSKAKTLSYALLYGAGVKTIAKHMDTTPKKAAKYMENFFEKYPKIKEFIVKSKKQAYNNGYVESFMFRKRHLNPKFEFLDEYQKAGELRSMVNAIVQSSGADILKAAMIMSYKEIQKYNATIIAVIHDEILLTCPEIHAQKVKNIVEKCMIRAGVGLKVALEVKGNIGDNWGEIH